MKNYGSTVVLKSSKKFIIVDNTFLLFRHRDHISKCHNYIDSKHRDIKFTYEIEINANFSFLDVLEG